MKEKIDLFAKGIFSYNKPELTISVSSIYIAVEMGKVFKGSFLVSASDDRRFKGLVYSSDSLLTFSEETFAGREITIEYTFDATYLDINDVVKGQISLVTDAGEADIPFNAKVHVPSCATSVGPASDMFHFTSLAQTDWTEARDLFKTEEFRRSLSFHESNYDNLYRTLRRSSNTSLALEEFLVSVKKLPVEIRAGVNELSYENPKDNFSDTVTLYKNTWGYSQLTLDSCGDFIRLDRKIIWTDDFTGNSCTFGFEIDVSQLHNGTNLGKIIINSVHRVITIPVIVKNASDDLKASLARRKRRHHEMKLLSNYIEYKTGRLSLSKFVSEETKTLDSLRIFRTEGLFERCIRIWLQILGGHESQAITALAVIFEDEDWGDDAWLYAVSLYLKALVEPDGGQFLLLSQRLRELYENTRDARIYMFCIRLDRRNRLSRSARYDALKKGVNGGHCSPVILLEACSILNEEPTILKETLGFDLCVLSFGLKNKLFNKDLIMQFAYLAVREKNAGDLLLSVLIKACEQYHINETLEALCFHLVRAGRTDKTAFKWLLVGVIEQIPVKNLFETCLMAADMVPEKAFPKAMQAYFEGGIALEDRYKATFYANVVRFAGGLDNISTALMQQMTDFTRSRLSEGQIDENLAVLYNQVLDPATLKESEVSMLPDIIFKHRIVPESESVSSILVSHKETEDEQTVCVESGRAFADIFTEDAVILYCDEFGNRIVPSGDQHGSLLCSITRLITNAELIRRCLNECRDDERVILNCLENARYRDDTEEVVELVKSCIDQTNLEQRFHIECYRELIEYYYDNLEGELMEDLLVRLDLSVLDRTARARMIDFMIQRELYSLAMKNMELYGCTGVDIKRLAKLASRLIEVGDGRMGSRIFTDICFLVFRKKKHDERILEYLARYYNGDSDSMHMLWVTLVDNGIEADELEERLLSQLLFTESDMGYARDVFRRYYSHGGNRRLIRAYISYYAYHYLVFDQVPEKDMLELMRREADYEDNELNLLALLKYLSEQKQLSTEDLSFAEINLSRLEKKNVRMPFFRNFGEGVRIPESMRDKHYVEYHTDPSKRVRIHYLLLNNSNDGEYVDADMTDIGYGIFVSEFVLFYGEVLQYYISEEEGEDAFITESSEITPEPEMINAEETGYHSLNLIITAREMNDVKTMQKLLENHIRNDFLSRRLFEPIL